MPVSDYTPALEDVGVVDLQRTKDQYGSATGTFSDATTPTGAQVTSLIARAAQKVAMKIGTEIPTVCWDDAKDVVALRTAMYIETTYFAEQINENRSPYKTMLDQYKTDIADLQNAVTVATSNPGGLLADQPVIGPRFRFPPPPCDRGIFRI